MWNESGDGAGDNDTARAALRAPYSTLTVLVLAAAMTLLSLVTVLGNAMVILAFYVDRSLRMPSNYFILSLGVSDLLIGLEGFPIFTVYVIQKRWTLGWFVCDLWLSVDYVVCLASIYTVLMITIDRFCSVRLATAYRNWRTQRKVELMIVVVWLVPTVLFFLTIFGWSTFVGQRSIPDDQCYVQFMTNPYFNMSMYIAYYWSTLLVMLILYGGIYQSAQQLQRKAAQKQKRINDALRVRCSVKKQRDPENMLDIGNSLEEIPTTPLRQSSESSESSLFIAEQQRLRRLSAERHSVSANHRVSIHNLASVIMVKQKWRQLPRQSHVLAMDNCVSGFQGLEANGSPRVGRSRSLMPSPAQKASIARDRLTTPTSKAESLLRVSHPPSSINTAPPRQALLSDPSSLTTTGFTEQPTSDGETLQTLLVDEQTLACSTHSVGSEPSPPLHVVRPASPAFDPFAVFAHTDLSDLSFIDDEGDDVTQVTDIDIAERPAVHRPTLVVEPANYEDPPDPWAEQQAAWENRQKQRWNKSRQKEDLPLFIVDTVSSEHATECTQEGESSTAPLTQSKFAKKQSRGSKSSKSSRYLDPDKGSVISRKFSIRKVALHLRRVSRKVGAHTENRARKALRTITIILGAFIFFWTPFYVVATVYGFCPKCVPMWLYEASYYMCYLNSPINPFCYALANAQFKRAFLRILKGDIKRCS